MKKTIYGISIGCVETNARTVTGQRCRGNLRQILKSGRCLRFLETHSPLAAMLAENIRVHFGEHDEIIEYDGFWSSSLTDSTKRGKPDIELIDIPGRIPNINEILDVTSKPLIMDCDTGGNSTHFAIHVRKLEHMGVSAVIIEDKCGLKKNSLFGNEIDQSQESIEEFCYKIEGAKAALLSGELMIIARVESLILEKGMDDAVERASAYVGAGAEGIMIHSRQQSPEEALEFAKIFRAVHPSVPLICAPTSFNEIYHAELEHIGFNVVIYANHMLRASYLAMHNVAKDILVHGRTKEVEAQCIPIREVLELIPGTK